MSSATQTSNLTETPVAGIWDIDPSHTTVEFIGRHLVFTKVRGRFTDVAGHVTISEDPTASSVEVTLNSSSVNTGHDDRDGHLKSADFFDVENHPVITFKSTKVEWNGNEGTVTGDLTVKGVSKPITLHTEFSGVVTDPWGGTRAVFSAKGEVNREDWGLTWNMPLDKGGVLVSKNIDFEIETEIVLQK